MLNFFQKMSLYMLIGVMLIKKKHVKLEKGTKLKNFGDLPKN